MIEINKIYNMNCMDGFKQIDDNSIDLICTDPPYKVTSRGTSGTMGGYWKDAIAKVVKYLTTIVLKYPNICPNYIGY